MIFEIEDETRDFKTIYKKDYRKKRLRKSFIAQPFYTEVIGSNPITDEYKEYLHTNEQNERLPFRDRSESSGEYLNKVRNERPHLTKFLPQEPPNEEVIDREQNNLLKSNYQLNYNKSLDYLASRNRKDSYEIVLPQDYAIPETVQKQSFRDPLYFGTIDSLKTKQLKPPNNLDVNETERKILRIRTGYTEYQDFISKTGQKIIKEQFYGPPLPIKRPEEHIKGPDSPRSECSMIVYNTKYVLSQIM